MPDSKFNAERHNSLHYGDMDHLLNVRFSTHTVDIGAIVQGGSWKRQIRSSLAQQTFCRK